MTAPLWPIFSPTDTEKYLQCPRLRVLDGAWEPRTATYTPWRDIGTAIHLGLAHRFLDGAFPVATALASPVGEEGGEWEPEACGHLVEKGMAKALATDVTQGGRVVHVEWKPDGYHAILDLVHETPAGDLVVTDHKVKAKRPKIDEYATRDYDPAWQTWHYAWVVWRETGRVPTIQYHIIFLAPSPKALLFTPLTQPTEEGLNVWEGDARRIWADMARDTGLGNMTLPPPNTRSCHAYGRPCDFYQFCWSGLNGRTHEIDVLYRRKEG